MELVITEYRHGEHPNVERPSTKIYEILGEEGLRELVNDHYELLKNSPVKELFPEEGPGLEKAKKHAADFFVQICGGPMYFNKNRGRPMMYKRHLPHKITPEARKVWLECYRDALVKRELPEEVLVSFWKYLDVFSIWMVNS
jgi:hemoglobin